MTSSTPIAGLRALVVGGSAGIGREVGLRLSASGVAVAFHGRRRDRLDDAVLSAGSGHAIVGGSGIGRCVR
jgi:NADP-dependent 3-hydroxy acid dehydrogenase YdfG